MLAGLKSSIVESTLAKFEKDSQTLINKFSALAIECEEISYEESPDENKKLNLIERCNKLTADFQILEKKVQKLEEKSVQGKQQSVLKYLLLFIRRTSKLKEALLAAKIEKEEVRKARECGEVSDDDDDDNSESYSDKSECADDSDDASKTKDKREIDNQSDDSADANQNLRNENDDIKENSIVEAICSFEAEESNDLGFKTGEILTVLEISNEDGWWLAENENGDKGYVPSTYLKAFKSGEKEREMSDEDYPKDNLQEEEEEEESVIVSDSKRTSLLWSSIRNAVKEAKATDVLTALGALPSGFRHSTLGTALANGDEYTCKNFIKPKLCKSGLGFNDLYWDPSTSQIRARSTRILRLISLVRCLNIPPPGAGVEVLNRHVRICLFDGSSIRSNVHTVGAKWDARAPRTWSFISKIPLNATVIEEADCFVRSNDDDRNISLLFELCVSYIRPSTGEKGELSCGWAMQRLMDDSGLPVPNRNKELYINGGTPFEKGIEVDPTAVRKEVSNSFKAMMSRNRQPRLVLKIYGPTREQKENLDFLPDVIINNMQLLPFLVLYRQILADALLRDRIRAESCEKIHAPLISTFPQAIDQPDVMDVLRNAYNERLKTEKRINKRDREMKKQIFKKVYLETVYMLLYHINSLPAYKFADYEIINQRKEIMNEYMTKWNDQGTVSMLLGPTKTHKPFSITELTFDILSAEKS